MSSLRLLSGVALLAASAAASAAEPVTFNKHIAPILWANCASCHRSGEVGPFRLLTYQDAAKRADFLKDITADRRMPPWKPTADYGPAFHDARRLSDEQIALIAKWADAGAPEGSPSDLPTAPKFPDGGWANGKPDLILKMPESFTLPAGGRDVLQCFVLPIPIDGDKHVTAVEFHPGNRTIVHHAIFYLDSSGAARRKDAAEPGPGYRTFGGPGILPTGGLGAWVPGASQRPLPDGVGKLLKKGSDLVLQIHYHPSGKEERDQSELGIYFAKKPAEKLVGSVGLRSRGIYLPAGESRVRVAAEGQELPCDVNVLSVAPHMHNLARECRAWAELPDGKTQPLIAIKDWDFNWQGSYHYVEPVRLPKGSVIRFEVFYDNSADNPKNPSNPPKPVRWGEQTTDEMCLLGVQVVTDNMADLRKLAALRSARLGNLLQGGVNLEDLPSESGDSSSTTTKPAGKLKTLLEKLRKKSSSSEPPKP